MMKERAAVMKQRGAIGVAMLLTFGAITGCAQSDDGSALKNPELAESTSADSQSVDLFTADTGVEAVPKMESHADWSVNVDDPAVLSEFSSAVVSGKVIGIERSYVDGNGLIVTAYSIQVEKIYKGENIADVISVTLPGGSVPLGDYIAALDKLGLYDMKLGRKDPEITGTARLDANQEKDPRTMDPSTAVAENWGVNPASESTVKRLQPDSWVFYIAIDGDTYYGAAFDHALSYLKDGQVYSLSPEADRSHIAESELSAR